MSDAVQYEVKDGVAMLRMDDGKANAITPARVAALRTTLDRAEREARAVVLAGRAERFCGGFDLATMRDSAAAALALTAAGGELALRILGFPRPVVIACTGHALAMGAVLLLSGDLRIGADGPFKIGLNETAIGLTLPTFAVELARARLAPTHLTRATLLAEIYTPRAAVGAGFLDQTVLPDRVVDAAVAEAARLGAISTDALAGSKRRLRGATIDYVRATLADDMRRLGGGE